MTMLSLFQSNGVSPPRHMTAVSNEDTTPAAAVTPESIYDHAIDQHHQQQQQSYTPVKMAGLGTKESPLVLEEKKSQDDDDVYENDAEYYGNEDDEENQEDSLLDWLDDALADDPPVPTSPEAKAVSMTKQNNHMVSPLQAEETVSTAPITPESMHETHEPMNEMETNNNETAFEPPVVHDDDSVSVLSDDSPVEKMERMEELEQQQAPLTPKAVKHTTPSTFAESKIPTLSSKSRLLQPTASRLGTATSPVRNRTPKPAQARHLAEQRVRQRKLKEQKEREEAHRKEQEEARKKSCRMTPQEGQVRAAARVYIRQKHAEALQQTKNTRNAVSSPKIHPAKPKSNKPLTKPHAPSLSTSQRALFREQQRANAKPAPKPPATGMGTRHWHPTVPKAPTFATDRRLATRSTSRPNSERSTTHAVSSPRRSPTPGRSTTPGRSGSSNWRPTKPKEFSFATDRRLGEKKKPAATTSLTSSTTTTTATESYTSRSSTSTGRSSPRMRAPSPRFSAAPDRSNTPKRSTSWRPTQPKEFSFATDRRIGRR